MGACDRSHADEQGHLEPLPVAVEAGRVPRRAWARRCPGPRRAVRDGRLRAGSAAARRPSRGRGCDGRRRAPTREVRPPLRAVRVGVGPAEVAQRMYSTPARTSWAAGASWPSVELSATAAKNRARSSSDPKQGSVEDGLHVGLGCDVAAPGLPLVDRADADTQPGGEGTQTEAKRGTKLFGFAARPAGDDGHRRRPWPLRASAPPTRRALRGCSHREGATHTRDGYPRRAGWCAILCP